MNNQVNNFDQMSQLENIARVKQFMRKGSVKLLMIVSFLQAVFIMVGSAMLGGLIEPLFKTLMEFMTKYGAREGIVMPYDLSKLDATAFSSLSSAAGVNLPLEGCTARAIEGKQSARQMSSSFSSSSTITFFRSMISLKFAMSIFFIRNLQFVAKIRKTVQIKCFYSPTLTFWANKT